MTAVHVNDFTCTAALLQRALPVLLLDRFGGVC